MGGDRVANIVLIVGALVLVVSSLMVRRLPAWSILTMAAIWGAVFAVGAALIYFLGAKPF